MRRFRQPDRYARSPGQAAPGARHLWEGLRYIFVPTPHGTEIVHGRQPDFNIVIPERGEAMGRAMQFVNNGSHITLPTHEAPTTKNFAMFAYLVRRDTSNTGQSIGSHGNQWTFQLNYGSGQIGLTCWGVQDIASTILGPVPNDGSATTVAVSDLDLGGGISSAKYMMNGKIETRLHFSPAAASGNILFIADNVFHTSPLLDTSIFCIYWWDRFVSEWELMQLHNDPFLPIWPDRRRFNPLGVGGGGGIEVVSQIPAFIGM